MGDFTYFLNKKRMIEPKNPQVKMKNPSKNLDQWIKKMKCSGDTGLGIESFKEINVGVDSEDVDSENKDSFDSLDEEELIEEIVLQHQYSDCEVSKVILPSGCSFSGVIRNGKRHGLCHITFLDGKVEEIHGQYARGKLNGRAKVRLRDETFLVGYFKNGILHGFVRYFDRRGRLVFLGNHSHGINVGVCWKIIKGGGSIVGNVDSNGNLTGNRIIYLYPDYSTGFFGTFSNGNLVAAFPSTVVDSFVDDKGIMVPVMEVTNNDLHHRSLGEFPNPDDSKSMLPDPYESKHVTIGKSEITGAGEGLFAVISIEANTVVSFYHGDKVKPEDFNPESWEGNCYKIFDPMDYPRGTIDIPTWAQSSARYSATLAHKTNHSFHPNAQFIVFDHPKYGIIPGIMTIEDVNEGDEILVSYGYDVTESPEWYKEKWQRELEETKEEIEDSENLFSL